MSVVPSEVRLRPATGADAASLAQIYNHYIRDTVITFEEIEVTDVDMLQRLSAVRDVALPWLVAARGDDILGYAYAAPWRTRSAYRFSVESTVYLAAEHTGQGLGRRLYQQLLDELRALDIHAVIGGITLPNPASVAVHERVGFRKVAHFPEVGRKFGRWLDVGYWQVVL